MNKKHFVIFFDRGVQITTTPREWARQNQGKFPSFDFSSNNTQDTPNTETVAKFLKESGYKVIEFEKNKLYVKL